MGSSIKIRPIDEQFVQSKVVRIRAIQSQLSSLKTRNEVMHYFISEINHCLEAGLLLASLQVSCSFFEYMIRYLIIMNRTAIVKTKSSRSNSELEYSISKEVEDVQKISFAKMLLELENNNLININEKDRFNNLYERVRIPIHHAIVGRYTSNNDDLGFYNEIFCIVGGRDFENTVEQYSLCEIEELCSCYKILFSKICT